MVILNNLFGDEFSRFVEFEPKYLPGALIFTIFLPPFYHDKDWVLALSLGPITAASPHTQSLTHSRDSRSNIFNNVLFPFSLQSRTPPSPQNSSAPEDLDPQREASPGNAKSPPPPVSYSGSAFGSIKPRSGKCSGLFHL